MKRATLALSLLSALSLTTLTACGGGDGDDGRTTASEKPKPSATATQAKPSADPAKQLAELLVTNAEAGGDYRIDEPAKEDAMATSQDQLQVAKPACAPLAYASNYLPIGDAEASLVRYASTGSYVYTYITLATYAEGKAEDAMKGLAAAASSCTTGYTAKSDKSSTTYTSVKKETAPSDPTADESLATTSTVEYKGTQTMRTQTFRFGDTIVNYFSINSGGFLQGQSSQATVPTDLVKAQNAKLG
jgi:hypothetical protein